MSQLIKILGVQLFSFFICTRFERWSSFCQLAHNYPLWLSDGKSSFFDSLLQEKDLFHTFPEKNLLQVRCLFQQGLTATIDSDWYEGHQSRVCLQLHLLENISSEAATGKKQELGTKAFVDSFDNSWREKKTHCPDATGDQKICRFTNVLGEKNINFTQAESFHH